MFYTRLQQRGAASRRDSLHRPLLAGGLAKATHFLQQQLYLLLLGGHHAVGRRERDISPAWTECRSGGGKAVVVVRCPGASAACLTFHSAINQDAFQSPLSWRTTPQPLTPPLVRNRTRIPRE